MKRGSFLQTKIRRDADTIRHHTQNMLTAVLQYAHGRFAYVPEVLHQAAATTDLGIGCVSFGLQLLLLLVQLNVFSFVLLVLAQGLRL